MLVLLIRIKLLKDRIRIFDRNNVIEEKLQVSINQSEEYVFKVASNVENFIIIIYCIIIAFPIGVKFQKCVQKFAWMENTDASCQCFKK